MGDRLSRQILNAHSQRARSAPSLLSHGVPLTLLLSLGLQYRTEAERRLDAPHVVFLPISLRRLLQNILAYVQARQRKVQSSHLLTDGYAFPVHPHDRHRVHVVLLELDLQRTVMPLRPLC